MNLNLDQVDHVTLDLMVNQPQYERYLRMREADLNGKFEKAKRFYKKRIVEMTRDLLKGESESASDTFMLQAFNTYAKACITYFRNKDKNDVLQEEYIAECVAIGHLPSIVEEEAAACNMNFDDDAYDDYDAANDASVSNDTKRKLEILMSFDKHKPQTPTLDTFVIKTTPPPISKPVPVPQFKEINLDDPKFKTKDIKPKTSKPKS
jgi:hypothetical protein|uniref:Uncharacterized protein n=1 Tax=viral metagenome TaxID=1070528 RepID=A0A6C0M3W7_9ZZZZ